VNVEKLAAKSVDIEREKFFQGILVGLFQVFHEGLELQRLGIVIAGGIDELRQFALGKLAKRGRGHHSCLFKIRDSLLYISPGCGLCEDSPYDNLERSVSRPPVLRAVASKEQAINFG